MPQDKPEVEVGQFLNWEWEFDLKTQKTWFTAEGSDYSYARVGLLTEPMAMNFIYGCIIGIPVIRGALIQNLQKDISFSKDLTPEEKRKFRALIPAY